MNARTLSSGFRLIRACSSKYSLPLKFVSSPLPRCFSSLSSRLYASSNATRIQSSIVGVGNVKKYTEQHEWIEIDADDIGKTRLQCLC